MSVERITRQGVTPTETARITGGNSDLYPRPPRTESEVAADTVWLLLLHGMIDRRRWDARALAEAVGITTTDLDRSQQRCTEQGYEALYPEAGQAAQPNPAVRTGGGPGPSGHTGERRCPRCGEWRPTEMFPVEPQRRRGAICEICAGELERDHYVAIRKAKPLGTIAAYFEFRKGDPMGGTTCPRCGEPFKVGDRCVVEGEARHETCRKVRR